MNDNGDVAGYFMDGSQDNKTRAFLRNRAGTFRVFDAPDALSTAAYAINASGSVAGTFSDVIRSSPRGFVREGGEKFSAFDASNELGTTYSINAAGEIAGYLWDITLSKGRGFVRDRLGTLTIFDAPHATYTTANSISSNGEVTGDFNDSTQDFRLRAFVRRSQELKRVPAPALGKARPE